MLFLGMKMTDLEVIDPKFAIPIWKVSHGKNDITPKQSEWLEQHNYLTVHKSTPKSQGEKFQNSLSIGAVVNLSRSGDVIALVRVVSACIEEKDTPLDEGWLFKRYECIKKLSEPKAYKSEFMKGWTPNYNGTIFQVPENQYEEFEQNILTPFYDITLKGLNKLLLDKTSSEQVICSSQDSTVVNISPLNQILYGPPGTGKTFHTIEAAVKAAEPEFYQKLQIDSLIGATQEQRAQLQSKFKELSDSKRIHFVTFHQSYGYEEFVEGLKAECNDEGQISYCVEAGIFKQICQDAKSSNAEHQQFDSALEKLKELCSDEQNPLRVKTSNKSEFDVVYRGGKTFLLDPVSAGKSCGYSASLENIKKLYLTGNKDGIYNISYVRGLLEYMREHLNLSPISQHEKQVQPYVLVIDEINRGNISKIFGELITLIEPSKRKGAEEALEVTLPYSGDTFSVPDNLYIIGTMNTADRSLALMDTALRRRFDFVEMMPKPELFKNRKIRNIDLTKLLTTLNKRIEVLYDREHTLGHAFLFPVYNEQDEDKAFELLKAAFKNKIIPLLEEYFFDDWNKIRLVLGDNQKEKMLCFVTKQEYNYESLFGADHGLNTYEGAKVTFQLASFDGENSVWNNPQAYIAVYASTK